MFGRGQTLTFKKHDRGHHQTMKYKICDLLGVHNYAYRSRKNNCFRLLMKHIRCAPCILASTRPYLRLRGKHAISEELVWLMFVRRHLVLPEGCCARLIPNSEREFRINSLMLIFCIIVLIINTGCLAKVLACTNISRVF